MPQNSSGAKGRAATTHHAKCEHLDQVIALLGEAIDSRLKTFKHSPTAVHWLKLQTALVAYQQTKEIPTLSGRGSMLSLWNRCRGDVDSFVSKL